MSEFHKLLQQTSLWLMFTKNAEGKNNLCHSIWNRNSNKKLDWIKLQGTREIEDMCLVSWENESYVGKSFKDLQWALRVKVVCIWSVSVDQKQKVFLDASEFISNIMGLLWFHKITHPQIFLYLSRGCKVFFWWVKKKHFINV